MKNIKAKIVEYYPMSDEALEAMLGNMTPMQCPKNTLLVRSGVTDRNVYFIDGESVFRGYSDMTTVDTVHPGDLGFMLMAKAVTETMKRAITQKYISE